MLVIGGAGWFALRSDQPKPVEKVEWMDPGTFSSGSAGAPAPAPSKADEPTDDTPPSRSAARKPVSTGENTPAPVPAADDPFATTRRATPTPTPKPAPTPTPKPTPTPTPAPKPTPQLTPKPTPKPKPTPTPTPKPRKPKEAPGPTPEKEKKKADDANDDDDKPTPKPDAPPKPKAAAVAKASPSPGPKSGASAKKKPDNAKPAHVDTPEEVAAKAAALAAGINAGGDDAGDDPGEGGFHGHGSGKGGGSSSGNGSGNGKGGSGGTSASDTGWYGDMIQTRFRSEWDSHALKGGESPTVRIRVEKDGRISKFSLSHPSGNAEIDDSVMAAAARVKQIEAPPPSLTKGKGYYEVGVRFELTE